MSLRLIPVTHEHVDVLHRMWTDPDVRRFLWDDVEIDRETARTTIEQTLLWLIVEHDEVVGFVGLRGPELLYGLLPSASHRGLATEASIAALQYAFDILGHEAVWAATDPPNVASVGVMERTGMKFDRRGTLDGRDTLFYRITAEQFRRSRS